MRIYEYYASTENPNLCAMTLITMLRSATDCSVALVGKWARSTKPFAVLRCCASSVAGTSSPTNIVLPPNRMEKAYIEPDTEKLTKFACINYLKDGKDPELKPDSEYPEWLWKVRTEPLPPVEDMSEEEHGWLYWRELTRNYRLQKSKQKQLALKYAAVQRKTKIL